MSRRTITPSDLARQITGVVVDTSSGFAFREADVTVGACDVQFANCTVTLPQFPQPGVTTIAFTSEQPFFLTGGAAFPLLPADPLPVGAGAAFSAAFSNSGGWEVRGQFCAMPITVSAYYGTGSDGNVVADGVNAIPGATLSGSTYTMTADVNYANFTVNSGVIVATAGFRLVCSGLLLNNGTIEDDGQDGQTPSEGVSNGGLGAPATSLGGGTNGGVGATGIASGTAGVSSAATTVPGTTSGGGGDGGAAGGQGASDGGSQQTVATTSTLEPFAVFHSWMVRGSSITPKTIVGGCGGGGGSSNNAGGIGGGGGGGGGIMLIAAFFIINNGSIHSNGGAGFDGAGVAAAGGGGGGQGGAVYVYTRTLGNRAVSGAQGNGFLPMGVGSVAAVGGLGGAARDGGSLPGSPGTIGRVITTIA